MVDERHPLHELVGGLQELERFTEFQLGRLTLAETSTLAARLAARPLADADIAMLYRETEGNALFVVEALRAGWTGESAVDGWMTKKMQTVIESRLARVSNPARDLLGVAATIGRAFTTDVLAEAGKVDTDTLVYSLDDLWRRRIIREQGADAYDFSHDKIREVAYLALSPALRSRNHLRVALALERLHRDSPGPVSGQIAAQFERAGAIDQAVTWYPRAAAAAQQVHANVEAIRLLYRALDLLRTLPETAERQARELAILTTLPTLLGWVEGWASARLIAVQQRALDLAGTLGIEPASPLLRSLAVASLARRNFASAQRVGERLHARGERDADALLCVEAAYVLGIAAFWQAQLEAARGHFERAVVRYDPDHRRAHLLQYGMDPQVICLSRLGNTLWFQGYVTEAVRARDAALVLADEIGHPATRATALVFAAMLSIDMRDREGVRRYTAMLRSERGDQESRPTGIATQALAGYVDVLDGRTEAGIARIKGVLNETRGADHAPGLRAYLVRVLLEACVVAQDARTGLAAADWALGHIDADRLWEAETRRLRAEFLTKLGAASEDIVEELEQALAVARAQGATMLELRAAVDLLRHQLDRDDGPTVRRTRELLAAIVTGLPREGNAPDLRAASILLGRH
jgi:tetratricopeptide (TPR) repeat protein